MAEHPPATLRLKLDPAALAGNWAALDRLSGPAEAGAAVKADAYGLGVDRVVPVLRDAGAASFLVAHWSEVEAVARHVPARAISVLHGPVWDADAAYARASGARPVINSLSQAARWIETGGGPCDLMVDTGINRLGLSLHEVGDPLIGGLEVDTLMSHLASADEDGDLSLRQLARFRQVCAAIPARRRSLANSAGIALGPDYTFDLTRPGLALYGGIPRPELADTIRQVAFPEAAVIQRRRIARGETVGYNAAYTAPHAMEVAVVSIGYADGFLRCRGAHGAFSSGDRSLPILGRVSMDMVVISVDTAPDLREGDWVTIPFDLRSAALQSGLTQYELLTTLGQRFNKY